MRGRLFFWCRPAFRPARPRPGDHAPSLLRFRILSRAGSIQGSCLPVTPDAIRGPFREAIGLPETLSAPLWSFEMDAGSWPGMTKERDVIPVPDRVRDDGSGVHVGKAKKARENGFTG